MLRRSLLVAALAVPAALAAAPASAQAPWRMATEYPETSMPGEGFRAFAAALAEASGGRLAVEASYDAKAGIKSADMLTAVRDGRIEIGDAFTGAVGGAEPIFALPTLPFLSASIGEARLLYDVARRAYEEKLASLGQVLLYATPWPPSGVWAKKPIVAASDIAGLAIRTYDGTSTAVLKDAGAAAVLLSFADVMPKLKDGSVTAVLSSGDGGAGRKLWEYLPHFTEINYAVPLSLTTLRRASLDALSGDQRAAVTAAAQRAEAAQWKLIETRLDANYATMRQNGVAIARPATRPVLDALAKAADKAIADWTAKAGPAGVAVLAEYRRRRGR